MAENEMMTGYLAGKSDAGGNCCAWPMMGMYPGMMGGFGGYGGYGGMIAEWIPLLFLAGIFGWGNNGFGGWGGGNGGFGAVATQADLAAGFNNSAVLNNLNDLKLGQVLTVTLGAVVALALLELEDELLVALELVDNLGGDLLLGKLVEHRAYFLVQFCGLIFHSGSAQLTYSITHGLSVISVVESSLLLLTDSL